MVSSNWRDEPKLFGAARETKQYERAVAALRESEATLRRAQAIAHIGSWSLDLVSNRLTVSDEVVRMFGGSPDDPSTYESIFSVVHPDDRGALDREWNAALQTGTFDMDHRVVLGDDVRWVRQKAEVEFDEHGNATVIEGTVQDITDRRRAEEEIRNLNAELEQRVAARTAELEAARNRETTLAWRIQQMLLLEPPPQEISGLRVAALTLPSQQVDGDFFGFFQHERCCFDVFIGDVMGKGTPAALLGAATKNILIEGLAHLMAVARREELPAAGEIVMRAHSGIVRQLIELESFVTLCYARFDLNHNVLEFVDCGHTGTIRLAAGTGACSVLQGDNLALGIREDECFGEVSVMFEPGDVFVLFSDGITEARNSEHELFGVDRLLECVRVNHELEPESLLERIRSAVVDFSGSERLKDDLTCLAIKILDPRLPVGRWELDIASDFGELGRVRTFVREVCGAARDAHITEHWISELELAVNEAASNVIKHAHQGRVDQRIILEAEVFPNHISIRVVYLGEQFDPSAVVPFDPFLAAPALETTRESGFGLYLISQTVNKVDYSRDERGRNCISLFKTYT
jgi:PAS domain S-box-containing protein